MKGTHAVIDFGMAFLFVGGDTGRCHGVCPGCGVFVTGGLFLIVPPFGHVGINDGGGAGGGGLGGGAVGGGVVVAVGTMIVAAGTSGGVDAG